MRLTIILPTYNEAENLRILIPNLIEYISNHNLSPAEILVMDDKSPDGTANVAKNFLTVASKNNINLIVIVRGGVRGLTPAVIDGIKMAKGDAILTMDSDLSHPVNAIKKLVLAVTAWGGNLSVGSRRCKGGSYDQNWPNHRKLISFISGLLGKLLDWRITDPMSGFFCFSRNFLQKNDLTKLKGNGFKILLEIVVKFKPEKIIEIPINFKDRMYGVSKMSMGVMQKYIIQLINLYKYKLLKK